MDLNRFTVNINASIKDVLIKIDKLPSVQTVFVLDDNEIVKGTITDGDIRRGIINGLKLDNPISDFLYKEFSFIKEEEENFKKLKEFRMRKLIAVPLLSKKGKLIKIYNFSKIKSLLPIDAVIMAGGKGERLKPLTNDIPKPLLKVGGKEIISYNFDRLHQFGISNQYITVNYLGEKIESYCSEYNKDINFKIIKETNFLGTAGSLSLIDNFKNDTILLMNSDLLTNIDFEDFYISFIEKEADIQVASIPYNINLPYAIFNTEESKIINYKEKPDYTYHANAGIYLLKREMLDFIPKGEFFNATDLLDKAISSNKKLIHYPIRGYWLDIGKHNDFEKAQKDIAHINWD